MNSLQLLPGAELAEKLLGRFRPALTLRRRALLRSAASALKRQGERRLARLVPGVEHRAAIGQQLNHRRRARERGGMERRVAGDVGVVDVDALVQQQLRDSHDVGLGTRDDGRVRVGDACARDVRRPHLARDGDA